MPPAPAHGCLIGAGDAKIFYQVDGSGSDVFVVVHGGPGAGMNDVPPDLEPFAGDYAIREAPVLTLSQPISPGAA